MTTPPNVGLGRLLREASTTFNRLFRAQLAPVGVTYGQFQYLQGLWEADGLTQTELTRRIGVELAASTAILDSLERRRLIKRVRNASDRRKLHVYLTPAGAALKDELMACVVAANTVARQDLSNADVIALFDILGRMTSSLKSSPLTQADDAPVVNRSRAVRPKVSKRSQRQALA